jgi:hypothetical protein
MNDDRLAGCSRSIRSRRVSAGKASRVAIGAFLHHRALSPLTARSGIPAVLDPAGHEVADVATLFFTMLLGALLSLSPPPLYGEGEVSCLSVVLWRGGLSVGGVTLLAPHPQ